MANPGVSDSIKAVIRYVLTPSSSSFNPDDLPWVKCCKPDQISGKVVGFVVYRGQSSNTETKIGIPRVGSNPNQIRTDLGKKPISTALQLNKHILTFAAKPGRVFKIHVAPGVEYVFLKDAIRGADLGPEAFEFLIAELPPGHTYIGKSPKDLRGIFFALLSKEMEVLLKPSSGYFQSEDLVPETWDRESGKSIEVFTDSKKNTVAVEVYETGFFPKKGGRGRTFRRKAKRSNKNGHRFTRKSKYDVRRNRNT